MQIVLASRTDNHNDLWPVGHKQVLHLTCNCILTYFCCITYKYLSFLDDAGTGHNISLLPSLINELYKNL